MTFGLRYGGPGLFRQRGRLQWADPSLKRRAADLGWNGRAPLRYHDSDGQLLGGFVPEAA